MGIEPSSSFSHPRLHGADRKGVLFHIAQFVIQFRVMGVQES